MLEASRKANPEALSAVAAHVQREYGYEGYQIGIAETGIAGVAVFHVEHVDGSRFNLVADRWGNVKRPADNTIETLRRLRHDMTQAAIAV